MAKMTLRLLLALFCAFSGCIISIRAIHEDEQGLRDWILRFVGHVENAVFHPELKLKNTYVTSTQGAVAAISNVNGQLQWRKVFDEGRVCVGAAGSNVIVSSRTGVVNLLNANTGAVEATLKLLLPVGAHVRACDAYDDNTMRVVASNGDKAYFFDFNSNTDIDEVAISSQLYIGEGAKEVHLGKNHLWVTRGRTADRYSLKGDVEVTGVEASHKVVTSSSGDTLLQSVDKVIVMNHNSKTISETECRSCAASMLLSPSGEFKGQVTAEEGLDGFDIKFPSNVVHVPLKGGVAGTPAILFAVYDSDQGPWALVRARNGHLIAVSERNGEMWERWEGLGALVMTVISDSSFREDRFGLWKTALGISSYGLVYSIPFIGMGSNIRVLADISKIVLQGTGASSMESVTVEQLQVSGGNTLHVLTSFGNVKLMVDLNTLTGNMNMASKHVDSLIVTPTFDIKRSLVVKGTIPTQDLHTYTVNTTSGVIEGFLVAGATPAKLLWTVRLPFSIVAFSSGEDALRTSIVNHLRVFPNKSGSTEEVRRKFPMRNVLAVAYYEPVEDEMPTLVVTAIDTITGSVLASVRHRNVEGAVHILIVEHVVLYHFMDVEKMRHSLGVWEMFEAEVGPVILRDAGATLPQVVTSFFSHTKRSFSSRATRPPVVAGSVLGMRGGEIASIGVTTSLGSIGRKSVLFAFTSGRVAAVELNRLLPGGQVPFDESGTRLSHIIIPSTSIVTYKYRLARPSQIITRPTNLESSCHVFVSGMDLFYVRASSGKEFDLLNSDFNKSLLIGLTCGFGILSLVARYFASRKGVNQLWH